MNEQERARPDSYRISYETLRHTPENGLREWFGNRMQWGSSEPKWELDNLEGPEAFVYWMCEVDPELGSKFTNLTIQMLGDVAKDPNSVSDSRYVASLANVARVISPRESFSDAGMLAHRYEAQGFRDLNHLPVRSVLRLVVAGQERHDESWVPFWIKLWDQSRPEFWAVATAGLRKSNPEVALSILPEVIKRSQEFPEYINLSNFLRLLEKDNTVVDKFSDVISGLTPEERRFYERALGETS